MWVVHCAVGCNTNCYGTKQGIFPQKVPCTVELWKWWAKHHTECVTSGDVFEPNNYSLESALEGLGILIAPETSEMNPFSSTSFAEGRSRRAYKGTHDAPSSKKDNLVSGKRTKRSTCGLRVTGIETCHCRRQQRNWLRSSMKRRAQHV